MLSAKRFRLYETSNAGYGEPDYDRLKGLATKWLMKQLGQSRNELDQNQVLVFIEEFHKRYKKKTTETEGICAGMVCNWAWNYLSTNNPEIKPDENVSRRLQGGAEMTSYKRAAMNKEDPTGVAKQKMYRKFFAWPMVVEKEMAAQQFPSATWQFGTSTTQMVNKVMEKEHQPFELSVRIKAPDRDGKVTEGGHAIGLLYHTPTFYVLEPNYGLYKFPQSERAQQELNNHFIQKCPPQSPWELTKIDIDLIPDVQPHEFTLTVHGSWPDDSLRLEYEVRLRNNQATAKGGQTDGQGKATIRGFSPDEAEIHFIGLERDWTRVRLGTQFMLPGGRYTFICK